MGSSSELVLRAGPSNGFKISGEMATLGGGVLGTGGGVAGRRGETSSQSGSPLDTQLGDASAMVIGDGGGGGGTLGGSGGFDSAAG